MKLQYNGVSVPTQHDRNQDPDFMDAALQWEPQSLRVDVSCLTQTQTHKISRQITENQTHFILNQWTKTNWVRLKSE